MRFLFLSLFLFCLETSSIYAHTKHKVVHLLHHAVHVYHKLHKSHPREKGKKEQACLVRALLNESVGVKNVRARIEVARVIINRTLNPHFPHTFCGVYHQVHRYRRKIKCEFSDMCKHYHKHPFSPEDYRKAEEIAHRAVSDTYRYGIGKYLYFSSNGTCPVRASSFTHIGPFIFCKPLHLT